MRDFSNKIDSTAPLASGILSAEEDNVRFEELENAVTKAGISLDPDVGPDTDKTMLAQAMARFASGGVFGTDGGAANAYVVTAVSPFQPPKALFDGMRVLFYPGNTNTGASTINAYALGVKDIVDKDGNALTGDEVLADTLLELVYDLALGKFKITPWAQNATVSTTEFWRNSPTFPHNLEANAKFVVSNLGGGTLEVAAAQEWVWRGWIKYNTDSFVGAAKQFTTSASKTYHLRWHAPDTGDATPVATYPSGRWVIKDLADSGYNPSTLAETDAAFDSTYDDMLIARVVTDGSNVPTITTLANLHTLTGEIEGLARNHTGSADANTDHDFSISWARTPFLQLSAVRPPGNSRDSDYDIYPATVTRTDIQIYSWSWHDSTYMQSPGFTYQLRA